MLDASLIIAYIIPITNKADPLANYLNDSTVISNAWIDLLILERCFTVYAF